MMNLRLAMVQMNAIVGDIRANTQAIGKWIKEAKRAKADVVVFPELAVPGYPPEDLLLMPEFLREVRRTRAGLCRLTGEIMAVIGSVDEEPLSENVRSSPENRGPLKPLNVAWVMANGQVCGTYVKQKLPNYGVFDEQRYFRPGMAAPVFQLGPVVIGVNICEDIWFVDGPFRDQTRIGKAHLILNINASPYHLGKTLERQRLLVDRARRHRLLISYTNMVGGQDELVFDGNSLMVNAEGKVLARGQSFKEDLLLVDLPKDLFFESRSKQGRSSTQQKRVPRVVIGWKPLPKVLHPDKSPRVVPPLSESEEIYHALMLGVMDYVRKNHFSRVLIGISGGIDSALTATIARDALGPSRVTGVMMPSRYTSTESIQDSRRLATNLGIRLLNIPIAKLLNDYLQLLEKSFYGLPPDTTEENLQSRIRGTLVMALSNKFGDLVLTTGNKSEMSVGYATLYGDMAGGFAVIKDVPKMLVYQLARWRSEYQGEALDRLIIPERIQGRAPSAELKPDQTDQDTLPPYPVLDAILEAYVEENRSKAAIVRMGYQTEVVNRVIDMVDRSEYKRRQAPVGIKITPRALGRDRRMPITNHYFSIRNC